MTQQPDGLAGQLQRALEHYRATWQSADAELYGLCQRRWSHHNFADVYTKVAIMGRVYEAGVPRSFQAPGDSEATVTYGLIEQADLIEKRLTALHGRRFDRQTAAEIVELHGGVTRKLAERTGDAWLTSFVSKYLHFHCPIVPLYDSNAAGRIGQFVDWQLVASVRDSLTTLPTGRGPTATSWPPSSSCTNGPGLRPRCSRASGILTTCSGSQRANKRGALRSCPSSCRGAVGFRSHAQ
jgi:hypothetical protein